MTRIAWVTDIHLNFISEQQIRRFCEEILKVSPDALLLAGDIAEAPSIGSYLLLLEQNLRLPIYFVLGNHDFYHGSISSVRHHITELCANSEWLRWLPAYGVIPLTSHTALLGHDSWADGRFGDYKKSDVLLNDYFLIEELTGLPKEARWNVQKDLADQSASYFRILLPRALQLFRKVILLMHVPPFKESCWYNGRISDDNYLPHFSCKAVGDALLETMENHPESEMLVLCGHTHGKGETQILPNLRVITGGATYGDPQLQPLITVE